MFFDQNSFLLNLMTPLHFGQYSFFLMLLAYQYHRYYYIYDKGVRLNSKYLHDQCMHFSPFPLLDFRLVLDIQNDCFYSSNDKYKEEDIHYSAIGYM